MTKTRWRVIEGDCRRVLRRLPDNSIHAIVTDPPYGLSREPDIAEVVSHWMEDIEYEHQHAGFMGKTWDRFVPSPLAWREALRVLKPGGYALVFAGTRTQDLMSMSLRFAGFEIRDTIAWMYGNGFPKSLDVSKAIDRAAGARREIVGTKLGQPGYSLAENRDDRTAYGAFTDSESEVAITAPATPEAGRWDGWGTALKPAFEPIIVARKPLRGTVAANVLEHGTGGLNIDRCRVGASGGGTHCSNRDKYGRCLGHKNAGRSTTGETFHGPESSGGRWPANVMLDEEAATMLDLQSGELRSGGGERQGVTDGGYHGRFSGNTPSRVVPPSKGGASRFFYVTKASRRERTLNGLIENRHPTVKPIKLMRQLVRLVTPPRGIVLDPFAGSGSTGCAAMLESVRFLGIELHEESAEMARKRVGAFDKAMRKRHG